MSTASNKSSPQLTTISMFFSDCDVMRKNYDLLSSLGFQSVDPVEILKSSRILGSFQTARISCGSLTIELISDPAFTRIRKSYGKLTSFARVLEIRRSVNCTRKDKIVPPSRSSFFSGLYPLTALRSSYPHNIPLFTMDTAEKEVVTNATDDNIPIQVKKTAKHFKSMKEIIIPCTTTDFSIMDTVQSTLLDTFGAIPMGSRLPGIFKIDLPDEEKLIIRTAPTNVCTIILKVDNLNKSSLVLRALDALGDSFGHNGTSSNGQIQIKMPGLDSGVEFRLTDSDIISAFYTEPPQSVIEDTLPEMQSSRVMMEGGGGMNQKVVTPLKAATGDCWKEVRVQLRNATK